jgi:hypothetical protein
MSELKDTGVTLLAVHPEYRKRVRVDDSNCADRVRSPLGVINRTSVSSKEKPQRKALRFSLNAEGSENVSGNKVRAWELGRDARKKEVKKKMAQQQQGRLSDMASRSPRLVARLKRTHEDYIRAATPKKDKRQKTTSSIVELPPSNDSEEIVKSTQYPLFGRGKDGKTTQDDVSHASSSLFESTVAVSDSQFSQARFDCGGLHEEELAKRSLRGQISIWDCGKCKTTHFSAGISLGTNNPIEISCKSCGWRPAGK